MSGHLQYLVHVGMPKCASTLIQQIIRGNESVLTNQLGYGLWNQDQGSQLASFTYPELAARNQELARKLSHTVVGPNVINYFQRMQNQPAVMALSGFYICYASALGLGGDAADPIVQGLAQRLQAAVHRSGCRNVLLTSEYLCNPATSVQAIKEICRDGQVRIVVVIRRQDKFLYSLYCMCVRAHALSLTYDQWLQSPDLQAIFGGVTNMIAWDQTLEAFAEEFGLENINLIFFEDIRRSAVDFVNSFLHLIHPQLNMKPDMALPALNPSMSDEGMDILRYANSVLAPQSAQRAQLRATLEKIFQKTPGGNSSDGLDEMARAELMATYIEGNRRAIKKFAPHRMNDAELMNYYTLQSGRS